MPNSTPTLADTLAALQQQTGIPAEDLKRYCLVRVVRDVRTAGGLNLSAGAVTLARPQGGQVWQMIRLGSGGLWHCLFAKDESVEVLEAPTA